MKAKQIRSTFLEFFEKKGHKIVPSSPMVVKDDPTLMFTNAGMNQFKDLFLGNAPVAHKRIADSQKCLRVSGKHNDLEEVGHDTYHHTMFEMLGNWSFGDYFKKEAIDWAWELLTEVFKLPQDRLYASVFEGAADDGTELDKEALELWKQKLPESHIIYGNKKDNFWEMGASGPCGPCSEIHVDIRDDSERQKVDGASLVNQDNPQVVEIWNLVFMQYNRKADGSLELLPDKHVDTGMGFERLCMALQGKQSNYDTDVFQPIIKKIAELANKEYGKQEKDDIAMRVIADHLRAISFSIADGQLPSNNKGGYVIRRILRRAVRYGYTFLGFSEAFMYRLVEVLVSEMGDAFPELKSQEDLITKVMREEESSFLRTLEKGIHMLDGVMEKVKGANSTQIDGATVFELYDTYGFPLDLTELIAKENGLTIDEQEFEKHLAQQKKTSQNAASIEASDWTELIPNVQTTFVGYDEVESKIKIGKYRTVKTKNKEQYQLVFNVTPFYAESGGQVGDAGTISAGNDRIKIIDTIKENNLSIHIAEKLPSNLTAEFTATVDVRARINTSNNHTATHLLHKALREVLGEHVEQKGSSVSPKGLRFDFSHFQKITDEELVEVQKKVNTAIRANICLNERRETPIAEARELGAMALFGEKYGDKVRVIQFGESVELCGGTHAKQTGQIGYFRIMQESAVSAGVRRIEAITGEEAENSIDRIVSILKEIQEQFNNSPSLLKTIKKHIEDNADLRKEIEVLTSKQINIMKEDLKKSIEVINGISIIEIKADFQAEHLKNLAFQLKGELQGDFAIMVGSNNGNKPMLMLMLSENLVKEGKNAGTIIRESAKLIGGSGGGQAFFATAGGKDSDKLSIALDKMKELVIA